VLALLEEPHAVAWELLRAQVGAAIDDRVLASHCRCHEVSRLEQHINLMLRLVTDEGALTSELLGCSGACLWVDATEAVGEMEEGWDPS
jgi:hypothetical protein